MCHSFFSSLALILSVDVCSLLKLSANYTTQFKRFQITQVISNENMSDKKVLHLANLNKNIVRMEYAVRGPIPIRAVELIKELKNNNSNLPFEEVIRANIGDCHMMGEQPITFIRQVLAASLDPKTALANPDLPEDVKEKVRLLLGYCGGGSVGSYSDSAGLEIVRRHVAEYIAERDGIESDWRNVILTSGASEAVKCFFALINSLSTDGLPTGVMVPIPQYPLYSATIAEMGMHLISYYLDEENEWALDTKELERALKSAEGKCKPKAIGKSIFKHQNNVLFILL